MADEKKRRAALYDHERSKESPPKNGDPKHDEKPKGTPAPAEKTQEALKDEPAEPAVTGVAERHRSEREAMHKAHEGERRDLHGNHREEHRKMHSRHEQAHKEMVARHLEEMAQAEAAPAAGGAEAGAMPAAAGPAGDAGAGAPTAAAAA